MFKKYSNIVSLKVIFFTLLTPFAVYYWFITGGTILGYLLVRTIAKLFQTIGTIGYHRWLCHNSFRPNLFGKYLMLFGMINNGVGKPLHVVVAHRAHHAHTDTELDPHSPKFKNMLDLWWGRFTLSTGTVVPRDFFRHKEVVFVNKYYWSLFAIFNLTLAAIDLQTALIYCPITIFNSYWGFIVINYLGHNGLHKDDIRPVNLKPTWALLCHGEELHENHHERPSSYHFGFNGRTDWSKKFIETVLMDSESKLRLIKSV
jgi:stearoyl-CoA desaturase (delta-9 desaturase)